MRNEKCPNCNQWKVECSHCEGRGYFDSFPVGTRDCDHCDGEGMRCPDAYMSSTCNR
jgi:DnaJ-class molecular chaperone